MDGQEVFVSAECEAALERLFIDAKTAADNGRHNSAYSGRYADDVDDDITFVRAELDIEL